MFIADILQSCRQGEGDFVIRTLAVLREQETKSVKFYRQIKKWQESSALSSDDIRGILNAFYGYLCAEAGKTVICNDLASWREHGGEGRAREFINLLLPFKSADIAERIKVEFARQEMAARVSHCISEIYQKMLSDLEFSDPDEPCGIDFMSESCPLDSARIFMQFLFNHISDSNWQKIASGSSNMRICRQRLLLELEYKQCQYTPGDPDYTDCESEYRILRGKISADFNACSSGCKSGLSPWSVRNILKNCVKIPSGGETRRWDWSKYCSMRAVVNGVESDPQYMSLCRSAAERAGREIMKDFFED